MDHLPTAAGARIPVKLYRRVSLIQTEDAILAEELLARKRLAQDLVGRLTDRVLLLRPTLQRYDEALVREVAGKLIKPRSRWPIEELIDRCVAVASNAAVVDRRL